MVRIDADVNIDGPPVLRRGLAERLLIRAMDRAERAMAEDARDRVKSGFNAAIRHQTPIYVPGIHVEQRGDAYAVVDGGQVYSWWLEGTGSRNRPRPGFPGYHVWERVAAQVPPLFWRAVDRAASALARRLA